MSVRTADVVAQAEKARVFSLRDAFGAPAAAPSTGATGGSAANGRLRLGSATIPVPFTPPAPAPSRSSAPSALSLKFSTPSQAPNAPTNLPAEILKSLPATNSIAGKRPATPMPPTTPTAPSPPTPTAAVRKVYPASAESARADVLRLAALVDDLQRKNAAFQTKVTAAERSAANATQRAAVERNALTSKLHGVQRELAISKDAEEKAKIELRAVSNAKLEVDAAKTSMHEKQLLALEQTKASLLQTLSSMHREHDGLKEQTKQLVLQADRAQETAQSKKQAAAALEASAAARVEAIRTSEEQERGRLEKLRAEVEAVAAELKSSKAKAALSVVMDTMASPEAPEGANAAEGAAAAPDVPDIPEAAPALAPAWSAEERRRADAACSCCAYGVPADLLGPLLEQVQETAGAPSGPKPKEAPAPDQSPEQALACAVEKDLLENFKHNILTHSGIPARQDVAPMFPHTEEHQGNGGYEGVLEKERPSHCADDEQK